MQSHISYLNNKETISTFKNCYQHLLIIKPTSRCLANRLTKFCPNPEHSLWLNVKKSHQEVANAVLCVFGGFKSVCHYFRHTREKNKHNTTQPKTNTSTAKPATTTTTTTTTRWTLRSAPPNNEASLPMFGQHVDQILGRVFDQSFETRTYSVQFYARPQIVMNVSFREKC